MSSSPNHRHRGRLGSPTSYRACSPALDAAAKGAVLAPTAAVPAINPSGGRVVLALSWFPREEFAAALEAWPQLADGWGTADHTEYNRRLTAPPRRNAHRARPGVDRPDPSRPAAQLVRTHRQRSRLWVRPLQLRRRARPHRLGRSHRLAAGSQRTVLVPQRAQVQAVLRTPERRSDTCGAVMARTCCRFASSSSKAGSRQHLATPGPDPPRRQSGAAGSCPAG